jgi:hypothetical protein
MKKIFVVGAFLLTVGVVMPAPAHALSCVDPEGMIDYVVKDPNSIVVTATVKEQAERVDQKAKKDDPNGMYDSGYTGQFLNIEKAHMGTVPDRQWVYFRRDATWNYLCAGEPPKVGSKNIYVLQMPQNVFELETVTAVYPVDSDMGKKLMKATEDADSEVEPMVYEVPKADWLTRLHDELKDMAFIIKVKLAEWTYWKSVK